MSGVKKPTPIAQCVVCSECGLGWDRHKVKTHQECIRLLKADLAARPKFQQWSINNAVSATQPSFSGYWLPNGGSCV